MSRSAASLAVTGIGRSSLRSTGHPLNSRKSLDRVVRLEGHLWYASNVAAGQRVPQVAAFWGIRRVGYAFAYAASSTRQDLPSCAGRTHTQCPPTALTRCSGGGPLVRLDDMEHAIVVEQHGTERDAGSHRCDSPRHVRHCTPVRELRLRLPEACPLLGGCKPLILPWLVDGTVDEARDSANETRHGSTLL